MDQLDKKSFIAQMERKEFLVGFFNYEEFNQLRKSSISNTIMSLYEEVYDIDDVHVDKDFIILFRKVDIIGHGFEKVRLVEKPETIYEKNTDDFEEYKAVITRLDIEPVFYYVRQAS